MLLFLLPAVKLHPNFFINPLSFLIALVALDALVKKEPPIQWFSKCWLTLSPHRPPSSPLSPHRSRPILMYTPLTPKHIYIYNQVRLVRKNDKSNRAKPCATHTSHHTTYIQLHKPWPWKVGTPMIRLLFDCHGFWHIEYVKKNPK